MKLTERERDGLTLWTFLYGTDGVSFETLHSAGLTGYFIFDIAMKNGLVTRDHDPETYQSMFSLTDQAVTIVKGEHHGSRKQ